MEGKQGVLHPLVCDGFPTQLQETPLGHVGLKGLSGAECRNAECESEDAGGEPVGGSGRSFPGEPPSTWHPGCRSQQQKATAFACAAGARSAGGEEAARVVGRGGRGDSRNRYQRVAQGVCHDPDALWELGFYHSLFGKASSLPSLW